MTTRRTFVGLLYGKATQSIIVATIVAAVILILSTTMTRGVANQITSLLLLMTLALAWNLVGGFGGQFSLGHSIFVGIGGYATALIMTYLKFPILPAIIMAGAVSAFIGVLLAYPLLRLRGPYLAVGSLGMALAVYGWMINWDFTKASSSYGIPAEGSIDIPTLLAYATVLAFIALVAVILLVRSPLGLRLVALRDDELGAASLGVRRVRTLIPVWALSGFLTGVMGALFALQQGTITVDSAFSIQFSLDAAIICVLGGLGTISGPVFGAIVVYYLRFYTADYSNWALLLEAIVLVAVVRFFPTGIAGAFTRLGGIVVRLAQKTRPSSADATKVTTTV